MSDCVDEKAICVPATDPILREMCARARAEHPSIEADDAAFASHLVSHARDLPGDQLGALRVGDLYLAWACVHGDSAALRVLEGLLAHVPAALIRIDRSATP